VIQRSGAQLLDAKNAVIATGVGVHQTALYDMLLAWVLFAILWNLYRKPRREGVITLTFGLYYGCARLLEDSLRIDKRFGPFTGSQWTALTVATISAAILIWWAVQARRRPQGDDDEKDTGQNGEPEEAIGAT
jgi:prolipoprotein diacylglyceryltransferase